MANIGEAIISIVADSNPFERTVRGMEGISGAAGAGAAASFEDRFASGMGRAGARAGGVLRKGILGAAAGVTAALTRSLIGGFRRMTTIEDATAVLTRQLGSAEQAAALLGKTLDVVRGTPFNLDQFAEATSRLVTANIELDKIPRVLTAIGESAAASGRGAEGVDQIVEAFGRMGTMATLSLREVRSLERLGVPALKILANQAGISADEMAKRISSGAVSSREAIEDLTEGILKGTGEGAEATASLAGSMEALREQTSGSLGGISAAMDRFGERVLTVFRDAGESGNNFARIFGGISRTIDVLTDRMGSKLEELAEGPQLEGIVQFFEKLPERVDRALSGEIDGRSMAQSLMDSLVRGFESIPIGTLSGAITRVVTRATVAFAANVGEIVTIVTVELVKAAPSIVSGFIRGLVQAFRNNPLPVAGVIVAMGLPGVGAGVTAFLAGMFAKLPLVGAIMSGLITALGGLSQSVVGLLTRLLAPAAPAVASMFGVIFSGPVLLAALGAAIGTLTAFLLSRIDGMFGTFLRFVVTLNPMSRMIGILSIAFRQGFPQFFANIRSGFDSVISFIRAIPGRIVGAFPSPGSLLRGIGSAIMGGLLGGILAGWNRVAGFLSSVASRIRRLKGPLDKDSRLLIPAGNAIMEGLNAGMERGLRDVLTTAAGVGPALERAIGKTAPFNPLSAAGGDLTAGGLPGGRPAIPMTNITVNVDSQDPEVIARAIGFEVARGSRR